MQRKFIFVIIAVTILLLGATGFVVSRKLNSPEKVHYHAGLVVFENGKKLDFSDIKYMNIKPCTLSGEEDDEKVDTQIEKAHLHDNVGDVVHVEAIGGVWQDLFTNINFPVDYSKTSAYINGNLVQSFETQPIKPFDSLVLFIGTVDKNLLSQAPTKEYIEEQEKKSTDCGE